MKKYYGVIYKITNKINGKIYIGQTKNSFKIRYKYNFEKYTTNYLIKKDLKKYGIENFEINEEFDFANSKEELNEKEIFWINYYGGCYSDKVYNLTEGGENGLGTYTKIIYTKIGKYNIYGELIDILTENNKLKNNIAKRINQNNGNIIKYQKFYYKYLEIKDKKINLNKNDLDFLEKEKINLKLKSLKTKQRNYILNLNKKNNIEDYLKMLIKISENNIDLLDKIDRDNWNKTNKIIKQDNNLFNLIHYYRLGYSGEDIYNILGIKESTGRKQINQKIKIIKNIIKK